MELVEFEEQTVIFAENQPAYLPLPAYQLKDIEGTIVFCWKMTIYERFKVLFTGKLWHDVLTFNQPLQPQRLSVNKPVMPKHQL